MVEPVLKEEATPVCNRFLIFTSGATPADLLVTSMGSSRCDPCIGGAQVRDRASIPGSATTSYD